jgi:hypothetical protein
VWDFGVFHTFSEIAKGLGRAALAEYALSSLIEETHGLGLGLDSFEG